MRGEFQEGQGRPLLGGGRWIIGTMKGGIALKMWEETSRKIGK